MTVGTDTSTSRSREREGRLSSSDGSGLGHDCPSQHHYAVRDSHSTRVHAWNLRLRAIRRGARPLANQGDAAARMPGP